jgi:hypothetical protein
MVQSTMVIVMGLTQYTMAHGYIWSKSMYRSRGTDHGTGHWSWHNVP